MTTQQEVDVLIRKLRKIGGQTKRQSKAALRKGARPIVAAAKANAPTSSATHYRYKNGQKIEYTPGNLRRSIQVLPLRKTESVFVGPKLNGVSVDGYYAHWVEFGTINQPPQPFMRPAAAQSGKTALSIAAQDLKRYILKNAQ